MVFKSDKKKKIKKNGSFYSTSILVFGVTLKKLMTVLSTVDV